MRKVLITGAGPNGFVGRNLREILLDRYEILAPSSKELDLLDADRVAEFIDRTGVSVVIHSAVHNPRNRGESCELENNLRMFLNLERCASRLEKLLYFGSGAEFDKRYPIAMVTEEDFSRSIPTEDYGLSKYIMNTVARGSKNVYNLRLFGIFGKYEYWQSKLISNLCCKAMYGLTLTIRQNCMFDFLYIDDLGPIVEWFIENIPSQRDYNICSGMPMDLVSIAETVRDVSGKDLDIVVAKQGFNLAYTADNSRLRSEYAGLCITGYPESVRALYDYYSAHREIIDLDILRVSI
jgi:GDP-L-fucose synthase